MYWFDDDDYEKLIKVFFKWLTTMIESEININQENLTATLRTIHV